MATDSKPKATPEPWYPFNSGPPKDKAHGGTSHTFAGPASAALAGASPDAHKQKPEPWYPFDSGPPKPHQPDTHQAAHAPAVAKAETTPAAAPLDFKRAAHPTPQMDKLVRPAPPNIIDRVKPEADVMRHAYEPAKPLVEKPQVSLMSAEKPHVPGGDPSKAAQLASSAHGHDGAKIAKSEPAMARVHVHPPTPPRSAFGELLHAEAKEMNRANGVIGSALAQGLHPDAIKAVVDNRLHGHAREVATNMLAGANDAEHLSAKLGESQKVASALQAAASKAINADHAEVIVASRLKGDAAAAGVSTVQALAGPSLTISVSEQQLAAAAPVARADAFDLPQIKVAGQPDAAPTVAVAPQSASPESAAAPAPTNDSGQPTLAAAEAAGVVTQPVPAPEYQPLPMTEQPKLASVEPSGVVTYPVPAPEYQSIPMTGPVPVVETLTATVAAPAAGAIAGGAGAVSAATQATMAEALATGAVSGALSVASESLGTKVQDSLAAASGKPEVPVEDRSTYASTTAPGKPEVVVEDRSTQASLADASAAGAASAASASTYSNMVGNKLRDAFSAASNITDTVSTAVQDGLAKGEAKLHYAADSVANVIQSAASAGAKVSLEDALAFHMQEKGFDAQSIAAAGQIAQAIRQDMRMEQHPADAVLVLHKAGAELASVVQAKDVPSVARPGDSVLAMDTLEKVADKGLDSSVIKELRGAMPDAVQGRSDLELAQSVGPAKSEIKGLDQAQSSEQAAQKQEKSAAAEQSRDAAAAMSMG